MQPNVLRLWGEGADRMSKNRCSESTCSMLYDTCRAFQFTYRSREIKYRLGSSVEARKQGESLTGEQAEMPGRTNGHVIGPDVLKDLCCLGLSNNEEWVQTFWQLQIPAGLLKNYVLLEMHFPAEKPKWTSARCKRVWSGASHFFDWD